MKVGVRTSVRGGAYGNGIASSGNGRDKSIRCRPVTGPVRPEARAPIPWIRGGKLLFKALATIVAVFVLILIAGLSGLSVRVWPTGFRLQ